MAPPRSRRHGADHTCVHAHAHAHHPSYRKKRLLASFVGLAAIGLIVGLAVGLKPERSAKNALTPVTTVRVCIHSSRVPRVPKPSGRVEPSL